jgi:hypothetical protein
MAMTPRGAPAGNLHQGVPPDASDAGRHVAPHSTPEIRLLCGCDDHVGSLHKTEGLEFVTDAPLPIHACLIEIGGIAECSACGITVRGASPVIALCRKLIEAGYDPARPMEIFRGPVLALRARSIGEAARLKVSTAGNGAPTFVIDPEYGGVTASPVRKNNHGHIGAPRRKKRTGDTTGKRAAPSRAKRGAAA